MKKETWIIFLILVLFAVAIGLTRQENKDRGSSSFSSDNQIAVVDLYGPIAFSAKTSLLSTGGADGTLAELKQIRVDKDVKAVILRINSPGGTVGASQELFDQIQKIKADLNIPVIASIGDIGASGAYYAALGADEIFANPGSLVGSIGVIMGSVNFSQLAEKYGVNFNVYKSGQYKDSLSGWRDSSPAEEKLLQGLVDNVYHQFVAVLVENRPITQDQAENIAQGQVFSGEQALAASLIDHVGSFDDVVMYTAKKAGIVGQPKLISKQGKGLQSLFSFLERDFGLRQLFNVAPVISF